VAPSSVDAAVPVTEALATSGAASTEVAPDALLASCNPSRLVRSYFCTNSSALTSKMKEALLAELAPLKVCASQPFVVRGFADTRGNRQRNLALATARATTVAELMRAEGFTVTEVRGDGELSSMEDDRNCANQRRVDVSFADAGAPASRACSSPEELAALTCS
jgi:outer membrane protein OmpA-like peptidoglycan-associated protein